MRGHRPGVEPVERFKASSLVMVVRRGAGERKEKRVRPRDGNPTIRTARREREAETEESTAMLSRNRTVRGRPLSARRIHWAPTTAAWLRRLTEPALLLVGGASGSVREAEAEQL